MRFVIFVFLGFLLCSLSSREVFASVYEFLPDGSVYVSEANDFRSRSEIRKNDKSDEVDHSHDESLDVMIHAAASKYDVDPDLIHALVRAESSYDLNAVSVKGAIGLMQLMPETAEMYGVSDIFDKSDNINGGVRYLKHLLARYHGDVILSIAAYNAGEGAVEKYNGIPPYPETIRHVEKVMGYLEQRQSERINH